MSERAVIGQEAGAEESVGRFVDLVYASALRQMGGDAHGAADVMQAVFIVAMEKRRAGKLPGEERLAGWLLKVTGYCVKKARRAAMRRSFHEQRAVAGGSAAMEREASAGEMTAALDEALMKLGEKDREVVVRRYLRGESVGDVAAAVKITENAASQRIGRALEKLRKILARRGVVAPAAALTGVMIAESAKAAPAGITAGGSVAAATIAKGAGAMMKAMALKAGALVAAGLLVTVGLSALCLMILKREVALPVAATATAPAEIVSTGPAALGGVELTDVEKGVVRAALRARMEAMNNFSVSYEQHADFPDGEPGEEKAGSLTLPVLSGSHMTKRSYRQLGEKWLFVDDDDGAYPILGKTELHRGHTVFTTLFNGKDYSEFVEPNGTGLIHTLRYGGAFDSLDPLLVLRKFQSKALFDKEHLEKCTMTQKGELVTLSWKESEWDLRRDKGYAAAAYRKRTTVEWVDVRGNDFVAVKTLAASGKEEFIFLPQQVEWVIRDPDTGKYRGMRGPIKLTKISYRAGDGANVDASYQMKWPVGAGVLDVETKLVLYAAADGTLGKGRQGASEEPVTELQKRYRYIFSSLDEKRDLDEQLRKKDGERRDKGAGGASDKEMMAAYMRATVMLWNKIEAAAKEVAVKHNVDVKALEESPKLPEDFEGMKRQEIMEAIEGRMVIPLDQKMAEEVVDLLNERYGKGKGR